MITGHAPTQLIADYAAGTLSQGMSLLVAGHLTFCPSCRDKVARLEALGGALMAEGGPVEPAPRCLEGALARIAAPDTAEEAGATPADALPRPLCQRLAVPVCDLRWQPVRPGLSSCSLGGFASERVDLLRASPGVCLRARGDTAPAATLVLAGRIRVDARTYRCGEVKLPEPRTGHRPEAVGPETCLCLVVAPPGPADAPGPAAPHRRQGRALRAPPRARR